MIAEPGLVAPVSRRMRLEIQRTANTQRLTTSLKQRFRVSNISSRMLRGFAAGLFPDCNKFSGRKFFYGIVEQLTLTLQLSRCIGRGLIARRHNVLCGLHPGFKLLFPLSQTQFIEEDIGLMNLPQQM